MPHCTLCFCNQDVVGVSSSADASPKRGVCIRSSNDQLAGGCSARCREATHPSLVASTWVSGMSSGVSSVA